MMQFLLFVSFVLSCSMTILVYPAGAGLEQETFAGTAPLLYGAQRQEPKTLQAANRVFALGELVFSEDFSSKDAPIWIEGNPERVRIENGRLYMDANHPDEPVLTVFIDRLFEGELYFEYDAEILRSDSAAGFPEPRDVNNLNTFLYYSDPEGRALRETSEGRMDGAYSHYHNLNGYIVTFLNGHLAELREGRRNSRHAVTVDENTGRVRLRENPGFVLRKEAFAEKSVSGRIYRMQFVYSGGELFFFIDGDFQLSFQPSPGKQFDSGHFAFRTFATEIAVDHFQVRRVHATPFRP